MNGKNVPNAAHRRRQVLAAVSALTLSLGLAAQTDANDAHALIPGVGKTVKTRDAASGMSSGKRRHQPIAESGMVTSRRRHGAADDWAQRGGHAGKRPHAATDDWAH